jgi:SAM-dependent methyltransferase
MAKLVRKRIPEGGAIKDSKGLSAEQYAAIMKKRMWSEYERYAAEILETGRLRKGARILEIGPGPGWIGLILAQARPDLEIAGVDASEDMVRAYSATIEAEGLGDRIVVRHGRVESLEDSFKGPFDLVYSNGSLHHWDDPHAGFESIRRVLAPGAWLILQDNRRDIGSAARLIVWFISGFVLGPMGRYWKSSIAAGFTAEEVSEFLAGSGFSAISVRGNFLDLIAKASA